MALYRSKSTVVRALTKTLECFSGPRSLILSYANDFDRLWRIEDFLATIQHSNVVIVQDHAEKPATLEGIDVSQWVSTADWIVTLSISAAKAIKGVEAAFKLFILELDGGAKNFSRKNKILADLLRSNRSPLPWISIVEPLDVLSLVSSLAESAELPLTSNSFSVLPPLWAAELTSPLSESDRHSVTNLVAPRILAVSMGSGESLLRPGALDLLMQALELIPATPEQMPAPWIQRKTWMSGRAVSRFVLIDDMADLGWGDFLRSALDLHSAELVAFAQLKFTRDAGGDYLMEEFSRLTDHNQIVFLDLRLFANLGWPSEASFFKALAVKARILSRSRTYTAWPTFTEEELSAVERVAKSKVRVENSDYHTALTIFPRLLALEDPLLPIILFSSTGRREILDKLLPYGNIITDFDKPRFFGQTGSTALLDCKQRLQRAFDKALRLARGRELCRALAKLAPSRVPLSLEGSPREAVISIYIDESAERSSQIPFSVGGFALIAPSAERMNSLNIELQSRGMMWGLAHNCPPYDSKEELPKNFVDKEPNDYPTHLARLDELFQELNIEISAFALVQRFPVCVASKSVPAMLDEGQIDNLYRSMLAELLEAVLLDLTAEWGDVAKITVDVATRQGIVSDPSQVGYLRDHFGIAFPKGQSARRSPQDHNPKTVSRFRYYSLGHADVYPIVAKLLSDRLRSGQSRPVKAARGVTLTDFARLKDLRDNPERYDRYKTLVEDTINPRPTQIHYLADWIARFGRWNRIPEIAQRWFRAGFLQDRNATLTSWLRAGRAADRGEYLDAIAEIIASGAITEPFFGCSFARWTRRRLAEWQKNLSGTELLALCDRIASLERIAPRRADH